jgi:hypothetical protein
LLVSAVVTILGWKRNLVAEGIEPNPGPTFEELVEKLKAKLKREFTNWEAPLQELKKLVNEAFPGLGVSLEDTLIYLNDPTIRLNYKSGDSAIAVVLDNIRSARWTLAMSPPGTTVGGW